MKNRIIAFVAMLALCSCGAKENGLSSSTGPKYSNYLSGEMCVFWLNGAEKPSLYWNLMSIPYEVRCEQTDALIPGDYLSLGCNSKVISVQAMVGGLPEVEKNDHFEIAEIRYCTIQEITFRNGVPYGEGLSFDNMNIVDSESGKPSFALTLDLDPVPFEDLEKGYACVSAVEAGKVRVIYAENPRP